MKLLITLIIIIILTALTGCEETVRQAQKQDSLTIGQMQRIEAWAKTVEQRFGVVQNNLMYLRRNMPDPNEIRDINLRIDDLDCRLEVFE